MSHNLSFAMFVVMISSIIRLIQRYASDWLFLAIVSLFFAVILLNRAQIYDSWHYKELLETVQVLHLEKRAIKDADSSNKTKAKN